MSGILEKKALRSAAGTMANTREDSKMEEPFFKGALISRMKLNYCAAPGLIAAGVYSVPGPRPPPDSKRPASPHLAAGSNTKKRRRGGKKRMEASDSVVDLTLDD